MRVTFLLAGVILGLGLGVGGALLWVAPAAPPRPPASDDSPRARAQAAELAKLRRQLGEERQRSRRLEDDLAAMPAADGAEVAGDLVGDVDPAAEEEELGEEAPAAPPPPARETVPIAKGVKRDRWGIPVGEKLEPEQIHTLLASKAARDQVRGLRALAQLPDRAQALAVAHDLLNSKSGLVRLQAMEALADLAGPAATPAIVPLLDAREGWLARSAARKLGELGDPGAVAPLQASFAAGGDRMRMDTALALRTLGDHSATNQLAVAAQEQLRGVDGSLRASAVRTLSALTDRAYNIDFVTALADTNSEVRAHAARALARQGTPFELPALHTLLADPVAGVRREARRAIDRIENPGGDRQR